MKIIEGSIVPNGGIGQFLLGMTINELNKLGFECYEDKYDYLISGVDGIAFELGDTDSDYDWNEKEAPIEWIFVYQTQEN